jgi:hypothetical protein
VCPWVDACGKCDGDLLVRALWVGPLNCAVGATFGLDDVTYIIHHQIRVGARNGHSSTVYGNGCIGVDVRDAVQWIGNKLSASNRRIGFSIRAFPSALPAAVVRHV